MAVWHSHLVLICLAAVPATAEDAIEHLRRATKVYSGLKSFQVEAVAERKIEAEGSSQRVVVRLYTSGQGKARIETLSSANLVQSVLISNGKIVTEYRGWTNQYTRLPADGISVTFSPDRATGWGEMSYETIADDVNKASIRGRQVLLVGEDRISCIVVGVEYVGRLSKYAFWIAEDSGLVLRRVVTFRSNEGTATLVSTVRALTVNEKILDSVFEFTPPAGATEVTVGRAASVALH